MKFKAVIQLDGKTATGIKVPEAIVNELGAGKKPPVKVTISGYTYRSTIASMRGEFKLPVSEEVRNNAGVAAGDSIEVNIELDTDSREVTVPTDLSDAIAKYTKAKEFFDGLSYSKKKWLIFPIEQTKNPETRQRRIEKAVKLLKEGKM